MEGFKDSPEFQSILNTIKKEDIEYDEEHPTDALILSINELKEAFSQNDLNTFMRSLKIIDDILETVDCDFTDIIQETNVYQIFEQILFTTQNISLIMISLKFLRNCMLVNPLFTDVFLSHDILNKIYEIVQPPLSYSTGSALEVLMYIIHDHEELANEVLEHVTPQLILSLLHSIGEGLIKMSNKISRTVAKYILFFIKTNKEMPDEVIPQIIEIVKFVLPMEFEGTDIMIDAITAMLENGTYSIDNFYNDNLEELIENVLSFKNAADIESIIHLFNYLLENGVDLMKFPLQKILETISTIFSIKSKNLMIEWISHALKKVHHENEPFIQQFLQMKGPDIISSLLIDTNQEEEENEEESQNVSFIPSDQPVSFQLLNIIVTTLCQFLNIISNDSVISLMNDKIVNALIEGLNIDEKSQRILLFQTLTRIAEIYSSKSILQSFIQTIEQFDAFSLLSSIEPEDEDEEAAFEGFTQIISSGQ